MPKIHAIQIFWDIFRKLSENSWKKLKVHQLDIINLSYGIVSNTSFKISRMAEVPVVDISRKRHLTPVSDDIRIVMQKEEESIDKSIIGNANILKECEKNVKPFTLDEDETQCDKLDDDVLSNLFSKPHHASNANYSPDVPVNVQNESEAISCDTGDKISDSLRGSASSCDEIQDMDVEDGAAKNNSRPADITAHVKVSRSVFSVLKTMDGAFAAKLAETGCTIKLPQKQKKPVKVLGSTEEDVQLACQLLKSGLATEKAERPQLTHFVSIRLTHTLVQERFEEFRAQTRDLQPDQELLPDRLFQRPEKLHISLSMLTLPDEAARQAAQDVLEDCCRQIRAQPPPDFRLRGLGTFGSRTRTRVLFSRPEPAERLQEAAELLHGRLCDAGLAVRQQGGITLHATLLNTTFLTRGAAGRRWRKFRGFDHGPIVEQLGEFDFGEVRLEAFEISSLTEKASDGYYASIGCGLLRDPVVALREESSERPRDGDEARSDVCSSECPMNVESESRQAGMTPVVSPPPPPSGDAPACAEETSADVQRPREVPGSPSSSQVSSQ